MIDSNFNNVNNKINSFKWSIVHIIYTEDVPLFWLESPYWHPQNPSHSQNELQQKKKSVDQKTLFSFFNSKSLQTGRGWIRHIASSIKFFIHKCVFFQVLTTFFFLLTEQLITLISAAKEHNIEFIYAISPGLDITFSNQKEVSTLKRKLDQVCFLLCGHDAYGNIKLGRWKRKQLCSSM